MWPETLLTVFTEGRAATEGGLDLDTLEAFIARGVRLPASGRVAEVSAAIDLQALE